MMRSGTAAANLEYQWNHSFIRWTIDDLTVQLHLIQLQLG